MFEILFNGAVIGVGATFAMDLWAVLLNKTIGQALPNWALVGRWFWHLGRWQVFHSDIAEATPYGQELRLGWLAHYAVGAIYGVLFVLIVGTPWLASPTFIPAWIFGIVTVAAGWFLLQPGLGLGVAAGKTEQPWKTRGHNLVAHTAFALGLWVTALALP